MEDTVESLDTRELDIGDEAEEVDCESGEINHLGEDPPPHRHCSADCVGQGLRKLK